MEMVVTVEFFGTGVSQDEGYSLGTPTVKRDAIAASRFPKISGTLIPKP